MEKTSEKILEHYRSLEDDTKPILQATFSLSDIKDNLRLQYRSLKSQQETSENTLAELRQKVISASRALLIAQNIFLNGNLKKFNAEKLQYEKAAKKFDSDFNFYQEQKNIFDNTKWENSAEKFQQSYYLTKTKIELENRKEELNNWKNKLNEDSKRLENICASDDAKQKIAIISASILRKNLPIVQAFEKEKKKFTELTLHIKLAQKRLNFIFTYSDKKNYFYRVIPSADLTRKKLADKNFIVSLIADALRGENYAVQLVTRSSVNNLEMKKNWELMSDIERDALISKKTSDLRGFST